MSEGRGALRAPALRALFEFYLEGLGDIKVPTKCSPDPTQNVRGVHPACLPSAHSTLRRN